MSFKVKYELDEVWHDAYIVINVNDRTLHFCGHGLGSYPLSRFTKINQYMEWQSMIVIDFDIDISLDYLFVRYIDKPDDHST